MNVINYQFMTVCPLILNFLHISFKNGLFLLITLASQTFYPNCPILLHGYIRHIRVIFQLCFVSPQLVNLLIAYVQSDEPIWRGYLYTITLIAVTMLNTIINSQYFFFQYSIGLKIRTALTSAIYRKSLRLSGASRKEMTVGASILEKGRD